MSVGITRFIIFKGRIMRLSAVDLALLGCGFRRVAFFECLFSDVKV